MERQDINNQLDRQKKVVHTLRLRLQHREIQEMRGGSNSDLNLLFEKAELAEQIAKKEAELERLELLKPRDTTSIAEAEYRVAVIEAWDTSLGVPSVIGAARLELARLRLGIDAQRTKAIEEEARVQLAEEAWRGIHPFALSHLLSTPELDELNKRDLAKIPGEEYIDPDLRVLDEHTGDELVKILQLGTADPVARRQALLEATRNALLILGRMARLHHTTLAWLILMTITIEAPPDVDNLFHLLVMATHADHNPSDFEVLRGFSSQLKAALNDREKYDLLFFSSVE